MAKSAIVRVDFDSPVLQREAPRRPQQELDRPGLALPQALRGGDVGLALLSAPAGYGKSTVMARWRDEFHADGVTCCWLELRDKHRDSKTLLQALTRALRHQVPELTLPLTETSLRSATSHMVEPLLASFMQEIEASEQRIVLFLDDLDVLASSAGRDVIQLIIKHRVAGLDLILGGRDARQFSLSRERLAGQLIELKTNELCFNEQEVQALFTQKFALQADADVMNLVLEKTEGWPAAVSLYGLGLSRGHSAAVLGAFAGSSDDLSAFLGEVMFDNMDEQARDLCMRAAIPEHFSLGLLEVLVPEMTAAAALKIILEASPFVRTLVAPRPQYRFHSLCQEYLRRRMQETDPARYEEVLDRAGNWCWHNGEQRNAVNYAKEARNWTLMAERVGAMAESTVRDTGEFDTYLKWLRELPAEVLKANPVLFMYQAWALSFKRDMAQSEIALGRLEALLPNMPDEQASNFRRQLELQRLLSDSIMDRAHPKLKEAQDWLERHPDAPVAERGPVHSIIATAARNANQPALALSALQASEVCCRQLGEDYSLGWVYNIRLSVLIKAGEFTQAAAVGEKALHDIGETLGKRSPAAGMSHAMLAYLAYEKGDISTCRNHLDQSLRFISSQGVVDPLYYAHLTLSWLAADDGNEQLAIDVLLEGERLGIELGLPRLTTQLATRRVLRYLHAGDEMAAEALMESHKLLSPPVDAFTEIHRQCAELLRLNMDLLQGQFREAADRAKSLSRCAQANGGFRMKAEYDYLWAIAIHGLGESKEAGRRFRELLANSAIQQRYRFMLQYRSLGRALISEHLASRQQEWNSGVTADAADGVLKRLADSLGLLENAALASDDSPVIEGLTKREVNILKRAARTGLNNRKLAEALFVTEGTLKWHLQNIYRKLDVKNRAGAIAQAQKIGLFTV